MENLHFRDLIEKYDKTSAFFYLDPPYIDDTKSKTTVYNEEMDQEDHREMVDILLGIEGKAMLSGYDHEIYDKLVENGWNKMEYSKVEKMSNHYKDRVKKIWFNYSEPNKQEKLF